MELSGFDVFVFLNEVEVFINAHHTSIVAISVILTVVTIIERRLAHLRHQRARSDNAEYVESLERRLSQRTEERDQARRELLKRSSAMPSVSRMRRTRTTYMGSKSTS